EGALRPGMRAEFAIILESREAAMTVPRRAVQGEGVLRHVFVVDREDPHEFVRTPVVVGQSNDLWSEILEGLQPGDRVVDQGAYGLAMTLVSGSTLKEALD